MYRVIKFFTDLQDNDYPYTVGDVFPREGIEVKEERLKELAGNDNKQGEPLIEEVVEDAETTEAAQKEQPAEVAKATRGKTTAKKE